MIVKITAQGGGAWLTETKDGSIHHDTGAEYFPAGATDAAPNKDDVMYWEAEDDTVGGLRFIAPSTPDAY